MNVDTDAPCVRCGYSLRGLPRSGVCPECALPVVRSLLGIPLRFASPEYVRRLVLGITIAEGGSVLIVVTLWVLAITMSMQGHRVLPPLSTFSISYFLVLLASIVSMVGWWLATTRDPRLGDDQGRATLRVWVQSTVFAVSVLLGCGPAMGWFFDGELVVVVVGMLLVVALGISLISCLMYITWLGSRMPNTRVEQWGIANTLAIPIIWILSMILACAGAVVAMFIGPAVTMILWIAMLEATRQGLRKSLAEITVRAAPPPRNTAESARV